MNRKKIIDKIAKCLRLAGSSNPNEAAMALRQAQAMMAKHGINDKEVDAAIISEMPTTTGTSHTPPGWLDRLATLVADAYGVYHFLSVTGRTNNYVFVGPDPVPEVAAYVFAVLRRQLVKSRNEFYQSRRGKKTNRIHKADIFAHGWVLAVSKKVNEFAQPLKVKEAINTYLELYHPGLTKYDIRATNIKAGNIGIMLDGMRAANGVQLNHGVKGDERRLLE